MKKLFSILALLLMTAGGVPAARAALQSVGPVTGPYGYPQSYIDSKNLSLTLCLDGDGAGLCIFDPVEAGNAWSQGTGFGAEAFWWLAEAQTRPLVAGGKSIITMALEAAYGGDATVKNGNQISFGRIRIRVDVPTPGTYTITHPFGTQVFENVTVADGISFVEDIGTMDVLDPANGFVGALQSKIGPFLTWPNYDDPVANPTLRVTDPVSGAVTAQYVGDPGVPHAVVGSTIPDASHPSGFQNYFRIQGPGGIDERTDLFTVMGKVLPAGAVATAHTFPPPPPQNLFAVGPVNRAAHFNPASTAPITGENLNGYPIGFPTWYQEWLTVPDPDQVTNPGGTIDVGGLQLTICPAIDPMCISAPVDPADPNSVALHVGEEAFWWSGEAFINDRTADVADPRGLDGILVLALEAAFGGTGSPADGQQIAFGRVRIRVDVPRDGDYTITHPYGTEVFRGVTVADGINFTRDIGTINPINPDNAFNGALFSDVNPFLTWPNFSDPAVPGNAVLQKPYDINDPASPIVQYVGDPATAHIVTGSPTGNNFFRIEGPTGTVQTNLFAVTGKVYDPATFRVLPNPNAPIAQNDTATVESGVSVAIGILGNDTVLNNPVVPANTTVTLLPPNGVNGPFNGIATLNLANNTITYSANAGFSGTDTFDYRITVGGLISNTATVTVDVRPVEVVAVSRAQLDLRRLEWNIAGTDTIPGTTITLHAGPTLGGPVIGTALVDKGGRWQFRGRVTRNPGVSSISVVTSGGKQLLNQPIRVR